MHRGRFIVAQVLCVILLLSSAPTLRAELPTTLLIGEIQTGSTLSAGEEFIELVNVSEDDVDVSSWRVEYFSASSMNFNTPSRVIVLNGIVQAGKQLLLSSTNYLAEEANIHFASTLAKAGGHVRLVSPDMANDGQYIVRDLVGWGTALLPETLAAPPPPEGVSLQRKVDETGKLIDSDNNSLDFSLNTVPTPQGDVQVVPPPDPDPPPDPNPDPNPNPDENILHPVVYLPIRLSELLPNPASPQTDAEHEYVEIFNPNNDAVDLEGYKLQTGNSYSYSYVFEEETIEPGQYKAYFVTQTDTLLANSGGKARLVDPSGVVLDETSYSAADDGEAWAFISGPLSSEWQWTTTPTAGAPNILALALVIPKPPKNAKPLAKLKTIKPKKSVKSATKKTPTTSSSSDQSEPATVDEPAPLHIGVLAGVGALAVGYAIYEYRNDLANRIYQFRRYRKARRTSRT